MLVNQLKTLGLPSERVAELVAQVAGQGDSIIGLLMAEFRAEKGNPQFRDHVILALQRIASPPACRALLEIANTNEPTANRMMAAAAFSIASRDPRDVQALLDCFDPRVKLVALERLTVPPDEELWKQVQALAKSPYPQLRWEALRHLAHAGGAEQMKLNLKTVVHSFEHADNIAKPPTVRPDGGSAAEYLSGLTRLRPGYTQADQTRRVCIDTLALGNWENQLLSQAQASQSGLARAAIVIARAQRGDKSSYQDLKSIIERQGDGWPRVWAIAALGWIGAAEDMPLLKKIEAETEWSYDHDGKPVYPARDAARRAQQQIEQATKR